VGIGSGFVVVFGLIAAKRLDGLTALFFVTTVATSLTGFLFPFHKYGGKKGDWREVVNDREVQYSNLVPGKYRFRVTACNNSGVWNEAGAFLTRVQMSANAINSTTWVNLMKGARLRIMLRSSGLLSRNHFGDPLVSLHHRPLFSQRLAHLLP
jgi:hypothetical protein